MAQPPYDLAIIGGGLAGGLAALAVQRLRPELRLALVEQGEALGGNHRWSWFEGDLDAEGAGLMLAFPATRWEEGHDVRFPGQARHLSGNYRSLASADFDRVLRRVLSGQRVLTGREVVACDAAGVTLAGGERIAARAVLDCRSFAPTRHLAGAWQLFVGQRLRTAVPHDLSAPLIMDAAVAQLGAYRFVYSLPLAPNEVFVEDTYYADMPHLERAALRARIAGYARARGWHGEPLEEEAGVLPVITGGDPEAHRRAMAPAGVALAGARGLFCHPLTSYTLPFAAATALAIARALPLPGSELAALLDARAATHWRATRFYRDLGRMLFAAAPEQRWRIFARFYRLPEPLVARFYAGRSTGWDKLRVLAGRPPLPIGRAIPALLGKGTKLVQEAPQ